LAEAVDDSGVDVTIAFDGEEADAASLLEIMTLGVGHGDEVTLSTDDDNAGAVLDSLVELLSRDLDKE
ncbi:HPr family phosphocarrier protein, partial [Schaalia cardiffensis]